MPEISADWWIAIGTLGGAAVSGGLTALGLWLVEKHRAHDTHVAAPLQALSDKIERTGKDAAEADREVEQRLLVAIAGGREADDRIAVVRREADQTYRDGVRQSLADIKSALGEHAKQQQSDTDRVSGKIDNLERKTDASFRQVWGAIDALRERISLHHEHRDEVRG